MPTSLQCIAMLKANQTVLDSVSKHQTYMSVKIHAGSVGYEVGIRNSLF